jgi:hypothetical protein
MSRHPRVDIGGEVYHIVNRANGRDYIFQNKDDYLSVINTVEETIKNSQ